MHDGALLISGDIIMAKQTFYFLETTFPQAVADANTDKTGYEISRSYLWEYIQATDSKYAKAIEGFVFDEVRHYPWNGNKAGVRIRFMNARHFEQYMKMVAEYRAWAEANKGLSFSHEVHADYDLSVSNDPYKADDETAIAPTSYEQRFEEFFDKIAQDRGFDIEG